MSNQNKPFKISVIVPIYNVEKYLRECLDSIINQTLKDIEIICINDGSTDNSRKILEEYSKKDERIKVINKENSGYGDSMNVGLSKATGEYIGIIEPDDFADLKMFESLYGLAIENGADIVKSEYFCYTTKNKQARKTGNFSKFKINKPFSLKDIPSLIRKPPSIWSAIYRKEFLIKNNINFLQTQGANYQDTSFCFKALCLAQKIVLTSKAYIYYRTDNINSSINSKVNCFSICKEFSEIDDFLNNNHSIKQFINTQKMIKQYDTYFWNLRRIDEKYRNDFIDEFSKTFKTYFETDEINDEFYKKVDKKEFLSLIQERELFKKEIIKKLETKKNDDRRRKNFSIRIDSSRISVVLFGKQIVEIG